MAQPIGQWYNADGLQVKFGEYYRNPANFVNRSRQALTAGPSQILEMDVDVTQLAASAVSFTTDINNDGTLDGFNIGDPFIPAWAGVTSAVFIVNTPFTGGTSIQVGLYQASGTALNATGLMTATEGAIANFGTQGNRIIGAGAYVSVSAGTASFGGSNAYVGLKVNGTFTAGTGRLIITYLETNFAPANLP